MKRQPSNNTETQMVQAVDECLTVPIDKQIIRRHSNTTVRGNKASIRVDIGARTSITSTLDKVTGLWVTRVPRMDHYIPSVVKARWNVLGLLRGNVSREIYAGNGDSLHVFVAGDEPFSAKVLASEGLFNMASISYKGRVK